MLPDLVRSLFYFLCLSSQCFLTSSFNLKFPASFQTTSFAMATESSEKEGRQLKVLGVCGGIGSGKSTACKLLVSDLGCIAHLDADSIAHSVYSPGSQAVKDVVAEFGSGILLDDSEDTIDRKKLGKMVFAERSAMQKLEQIVWPHVKTKLKEKIDSLRDVWTDETTEGSEPIIVLEAAILLDAGWDDLLDGVWAVRAPASVSLDRLMETRNLSKEESEKRMNAQQSSRGIGNIDEEVKNGVITATIENEGSLDDLKEALGLAMKDPKSWK
jgi:dephospho-CoA kinase